MPPAPRPSVPSEISQWISVSLHDIRARLEQNAVWLEPGAAGSFHFADDSLPGEPDEAGRAGGAAGWRCKAVPRLHLMLAGEHSLAFIRNEKPATVRLRPGDIWFFPADAHDNEEFATSCRYAAAIFHERFTRFILVNHEAAPGGPPAGRAAVRRTWVFHWQEERPSALAAAIDALSLSVLRDARAGAAPADRAAEIAAAPFLARAVWLLLHGWMRRAEGEPPPLGKAHASWLAIDGYLQTNYHHPLNRKTAAAALGLHPNRISALCAEFAGKSFTKILEERRLRQATRFLEDSTHKVETISALCGYASATHFSRTFRRATGVSPGMWRVRRRSRGELRNRDRADRRYPGDMAARDDQGGR